ncbi:hypothetical protein AFLA_004482 [Aspergillus flavus NRRL3357]|nr:hypothetical protein AFLA_004482 [Aspergillus flavus NRRL3357]
MSLHIFELDPGDSKENIGSPLAFSRGERGVLLHPQINCQIGPLSMNSCLGVPFQEAVILLDLGHATAGMAWSPCV